MVSIGLEDSAENVGGGKRESRCSHRLEGIWYGPVSLAPTGVDAPNDLKKRI
jgi:hypothetical protein